MEEIMTSGTIEGIGAEFSLKEIQEFGLDNLRKYGFDALKNAKNQGITILRYLENKALGFASEAARKIAESEAAKKAAHIALSASLASSRGAFLIIVGVNGFNFAKKLSKTNQSWLQQWWYNVGGDWEWLQKSVDLGKDKKRPIEWVTGRLKEILKKAGVGDMGATEIAAIITAATPIIILLYQSSKENNPQLASDIAAENDDWSAAAESWAEMHGGDMSLFDFTLDRGFESQAAKENYYALLNAQDNPPNQTSDTKFLWPDGNYYSRAYDPSKDFRWKDGSWHTVPENSGNGLGLNLSGIIKDYWWVLLALLFIKK